MQNNMVDEIINTDKENLLEDTTFIVDIDDKNTRIDKYLSDELADVIPNPQSICKKMAVSCIYRDITYPVLTDPNFHKLLCSDKHLRRYLERNNLIWENEALKAKDGQQGQLFD